MDVGSLAISNLTGQRDHTKAVEGTRMVGVEVTRHLSRAAVTFVARLVTKPPIALSGLM